MLRELGFTITLHDKMPDVVLYSEEKNWLYFIESVTSVGPMEPKRIKGETGWKEQRLSNKRTGYDFWENSRCQCNK